MLKTISKITAFMLTTAFFATLSTEGVASSRLKNGVDYLSPFSDGKKGTFLKVQEQDPSVSGFEKMTIVQIPHVVSAGPSTDDFVVKQSGYTSNPVNGGFTGSSYSAKQNLGISALGICQLTLDTVRRELNALYSLNQSVDALSPIKVWDASVCSKKVTIVPEVPNMQNAFYSREPSGARSIEFGSFTGKSRKIIYAGLSSDIAAHETGHCVLDMRKPTWLSGLGESSGYHEGGADVVALFTSIIAFPNQRNLLYNATEGDLHKNKNNLARVGEQFAIEGGFGTEIRNMDDDIVRKAGSEEHDLGQAWGDSMYDLWANSYHALTASSSKDLNMLIIGSWEDSFKETARVGLRLQLATEQYISRPDPMLSDFASTLYQLLREGKIIFTNDQVLQSRLKGDLADYAKQIFTNRGMSVNGVQGRPATNINARALLALQEGHKGCKKFDVLKKMAKGKDK